MTQKVRSLEPRVQPCAPESTMHNIANSPRIETSPRRPCANKDPARRALRTCIAQIANDCRTRVFRQWQPSVPLVLAMNKDFSMLPVKIVHGHFDHFSGTQSKTGQEQQDRIITPTRRRLAVARSKKQLDLPLRN